MRIVITNGSSVPIYEQIKQAIIADIMADNIKEDEQLPSIRELARDIGVSILTVKKAYDELESEGFILVRQGLGSFIAPKNAELEKERLQKEMEESLQKAMQIALRLNIKKPEIISLISYLLEDMENGK